MLISSVLPLSLLVVLFFPVKSFVTYPLVHRKVSTAAVTTTVPFTILHSGWSDFGMLEDDDDDDILMSDGVAVDRTDYAKEEDSQEAKARIGASLDPPTIEGGVAEPLFVPPGSQLELSEDNVLAILSACREEIGTLFGYTAENRGVGITGGVDFVELDGPSVVIRLKGRFWHQRTTVLDRVANYLQQRIPEIIDVMVEDEWQLTDEANEVF